MGNSGQSVIKLTSLKPNPKNPRIIKDEKFKKLCYSIKEFPKMMALRPIVVDKNNIIQGGNMRFKALIELGYKEIDNDWVKKVSDFSTDEFKQFVIRDNIHSGDWDWPLLPLDFNQDQLTDWGIEFNLTIIKNKKDFSDFLEPKFLLEITVKNEKEQQKIYDEFIKKGYQCRILTL